MKRGLLLIILLLGIILSTSALADLTSCNAGGGIWCGSLNSGSCELPQISLPTSYGVTNCVVSQNQLVLDSNSPYGLKYNFNSFAVSNSVTLRFVADYEGDCGSLQKGGAGGPKQTTKPQNGGYYGGKGGDGGDTCGFGTSGTDADCGDHCDHRGLGAGIPAYAGSHVYIQSKTITINGILDLSGYPGNNGGNARGDDDDGYGGGGASGGTGAGILNIITTDFKGNGNINLTGGNGGKGGQFNDDGGDQCQTSADPGTGGGGSGGGSGGNIITSATVPNTLNVDCSGGVGGKGGCYPDTWAEIGLPGENGETSTSCVSSTTPEPEAFCNDGIDNDLDGFTDFEDRDCYQKAVSDNIWAANIGDGQGPVIFDGDIPGTKDLKTTYPWFNETSNTGRDGVCGDDTLCSYKSSYNDCSSIPTDECNYYAANGCNLVGTGGVCSGGTTSCDNFINYNEPGHIPNGCVANAPSDCSLGPAYTCNNGAVCYNCTGTVACSNLEPSNCALPCTLTDQPGYCDGGQFCYRECQPGDQFCQGCDQEAYCSDWDNQGESACNNLQPDCTWVPGSNANSVCQGQFTQPVDCLTLNATECVANLNSCILSSSSDNFYFDKNGTTFCSSDYIINPADNILKKGVGVWTWWNANLDAAKYHIQRIEETI